MPFLTDLENLLAISCLLYINNTMQNAQLSKIQFQKYLHNLFKDICTQDNGLAKREFKFPAFQKYTQATSFSLLLSKRLFVLMALDYAFPQPAQPITADVQVSQEKRLGEPYQQDKALKQKEKQQVSSRSAPVVAQNGNEPAHTEHSKMVNGSHEEEVRQNKDSRNEHVGPATDLNENMPNHKAEMGDIAQQECTPNYISVLNKSQNKDQQMKLGDDIPVLKIPTVKFSSKENHLEKQLETKGEDSKVGGHPNSANDDTRQRKVKIATYVKQSQIYELDALNVTEKAFKHIMEIIFYGNETQQRDLVFRLIDVEDEGIITEDQLFVFLFNVISVKKSLHGIWKSHLAFFIREADEEERRRLLKTNGDNAHKLIEETNKGQQESMQCDVEYSNNMFNAKKKDTNALSEIQGGEGGHQASIDHSQRFFKSSNKNEPSDYVNDPNSMIGDNIKSRAINALINLTFLTAPITRSAEPPQSALNGEGIQGERLPPLIKARCITRSEFINEVGWRQKQVDKIIVEQQEEQFIEPNHQVQSVVQICPLSEQKPFMYLYRFVLDYLRLMLPCSWKYYQLLEQQDARRDQLVFSQSQIFPGQTIEGQLKIRPKSIAPGQQLQQIIQCIDGSQGRNMSLIQQTNGTILNIPALARGPSDFLPATTQQHFQQIMQLPQYPGFTSNEQFKIHPAYLQSLMQGAAMPFETKQNFQTNQLMAVASQALVGGAANGTNLFLPLCTQGEIAFMQQYGYIDPTTPNQRIRGAVDNQLKEQSSFTNNNQYAAQGVPGQHQIEEAKVNQGIAGLGWSQNANQQINQFFGGQNAGGVHLITVSQEGGNWNQNTKSYQTGAQNQYPVPQGVNFQSIRDQLSNKNVFNQRTNQSQSALQGQNHHINLNGLPNQYIQQHPIAQQDVPHHLSTFKRRRSPQLPQVININTTAQNSNIGQGSTSGIKVGRNSTPQEYDNVISGGFTRMGLGHNYNMATKKSNIQVNLTNLKESQLALQQLEDFKELDDNCDEVEAKRGLLSIIKRRENSPKRELRHNKNANSNLSMRVPIIKLEALERPIQQRAVNHTQGVFGKEQLPEGQQKFLAGLALAEAKENALKNKARNFSPSPVKIQQHQSRFKNLQISDSEIQPQNVEDPHYEDFISDESASLLGISEERNFPAASGFHTAVNPLIIEAKSNYQVLKRELNKSQNDLLSGGTVMTHQTQLISQLQQNSDTPPPPQAPLASYIPWKSCMQEISCLPYIQKRKEGQVLNLQNDLRASQKSDITFKTNMNLNYHELFKARQNLQEEDKSDLSGDLSGLSQNPMYKKLNTRELNIPGQGGLNLSQFQSIADSQSNGGICGSARVNIVGAQHTGSRFGGSGARVIKLRVGSKVSRASSRDDVTKLLPQQFLPMNNYQSALNQFIQIRQAQQHTPQLIIPQGQSIIDRVNSIAQNSGVINQGDYHAINWNNKTSLGQNYQNIQSSKNELLAPISLNNNNKNWAHQGTQGGGAEGTPKGEGQSHHTQFQSKFQPQVILHNPISAAQGIPKDRNFLMQVQSSIKDQAQLNLMHDSFYPMKQLGNNYVQNKNTNFRIGLHKGNTCGALDFFNYLCKDIVRQRVQQRQELINSEDAEASQDKWVVYFQVTPPDERQKILGVVQALHLCLQGPEVTCYQSSKLKNLLFQHSLPGCDFSLQETSTFKALSIQGPTSGDKKNDGSNEGKQPQIVDHDQNITDEGIEMKAILTIRITQEHKRVLYLRDIQIAKKLLNSLQRGARYWDSMDPRDSLARYQVATNDRRSLLGSGSFGKVYRAIDLKTQKVVALKKIAKKDMKQDQVLYIRQEIEILVALSEENHQGVIQVYDVFEDSQYFSIVMECVTGGSLQEWIMNVQKPAQFNEDSAREMMRQVTESIAFIHKRGIAHRDIKLENIMLAKLEDSSSAGKLVPKLVDFGLSGVFLGVERSLQTVGSVAFLSPEIVKTTPHTLKTDIWSIGIVFYISLTGRFPFIAQNVEQTMNNIENREPNFSQPCWQSVSAEAINLVSRMLCKDPSTRITAEEMLAHPWFQKKL